MPAGTALTPTTVTTQASTVRELCCGELFAARLAARRPAVRGVGIIVGHPGTPEVANRPTAADSTIEVEQFLNTLVR
jgi:hypothetical protein